MDEGGRIAERVSRGPLVGMGKNTSPESPSCERNVRGDVEIVPVPGFSVNGEALENKIERSAWILPGRKSAMNSDRRPGDARFGRHRDVPECAIAHSSNSVFRVRTVAGVVDCHKSRERFSMRLLVVLSVRCLKNRRLGVRLHFDPDVLEHDVLDDGRASGAHVEGG